MRWASASNARLLESRFTFDSRAILAAKATYSASVSSLMSPLLVGKEKHAKEKRVALQIKDALMIAICFEKEGRIGERQM
jgi:hypothetical protein